MRQTTFSRAHRRALPEQASRSRVALAEAASAICNPAGDPPELDLQNSVPACTLPSISSVPTSFWPVHPQRLLISLSESGAGISIIIHPSPGHDTYPTDQFVTKSNTSRTATEETEPPLVRSCTAGTSVDSHFRLCGN